MRAWVMELENSNCRNNKNRESVKRECEVNRVNWKRNGKAERDASGTCPEIPSVASTKTSICMLQVVLPALHI